jgi:hypothetical protein
VVAWALDRKRKTPWETCVAIAAVVAAWVPWLELWWGSVFYYGEVRDKQDLPWSVIHCGPIGATFFACYLISRVKLPWNSELVRILVRATMFVAVWPLQMELLSALARPWALDQS